MRVMVTGANGFVGRELVAKLLKQGEIREQKIEALLLLDQNLDDLPEDRRIRRHCGSITDSALLRRALADGVDVVFHLVSIAGGSAEKNYELGYQVNLQASLELLHQLRNHSRPPVLIYASSVAVYGGELPPRMDETFAAHPQLSYAAHKRMIEIAIEDLARRGEVDGRILRLPGIVARPREPNGLKSAFMSDLLHAFAAGDSYTCPVSPEATVWWMSARCCVENLLHAAELNELIEDRLWQLPVLHLSIAQVLDALAVRFGKANGEKIVFKPDSQLESLFGRLPPVRAPRARAKGFRHDGSAAALIRNALNNSARLNTAMTSISGTVAHGS